MNKKKFSVTNIGSISLLMIFIILCMVTLAALSLSSAASEANSSQKFADHNTKYYQASNQAEETLDIIDGILSESYTVSSDSTAYFSEVESRLSKLSTNITVNISTDNSVTGNDATNTDATDNNVAKNDIADNGTTANASATVSYTTVVNDSQALEVTLALADPFHSSDGFYRITSWKEVQTSDWNADNSINLMK